MMRRKGTLRQRLQSVIVAAAVAVAVIPTTLFATEPINVKAATDVVGDAVANTNQNEKQVLNAYNNLASKIKASDLQITAANKAEFDASGFYTMYEGNAERYRYTVDEVKYARRAYIYSHPTDLAAAMAQIKFLYIKKDNKYSCYAFLQRTSENDYSGETKRLTNAIKKITKKIDDDTTFIQELQAFEAVLDNTTYVNTGIDNKDLKNTAYGALVMHRASSQGYALAFSALLDKLDISNDILFNTGKCWNQVKVNKKWYESDLVYCDTHKVGTVDYTRFNTSQGKMKSYGLERTNYCTKLRKSEGTHKESNKKMDKYDADSFKNPENFTLGVLNEDGSVSRSTLTSTEETVAVVPAYKSNNQLYDCSSVLKSVAITTSKTASAFSWTEWTTEKPKITLTKLHNNLTTELDVTVVYDDGTAAGSPISFKVNLYDKDDTAAKGYKYKITGEDTASLVKCTKTSVKNVNIPSYVVIDKKTYKVTKIEKNAFKKCKKLETVKIGSNVTTIGANAFSGKNKLVRVETLGYSIDKIGKNAFQSADSYTMFLIRAKSSNKYKKIIKKFKKAGAKNSVYKYRQY